MESNIFNKLEALQLVLPLQTMYVTYSGIFPYL